MIHAHEPAVLENHSLDGELAIQTGQLPQRLVWSSDDFELVWRLHPIERHIVKMMGKPVEVPRWQQAYGANYSYTGSRNNALPVPSNLMPILQWCRQAIDGRLNGLLLNWYEGSEDYIGPHHDSTKDLAVGSPIITISFGETRVFRLTRWERRVKMAQQDFVAHHGRVFVVSWDLNKSWKHEVLKRTSYTGRRVSITLRAFVNGVLPPEQFTDFFGN